MMIVLDTDVLSAVVRDALRGPTARKLLARAGNEDAATTAINAGELLYGARRTRSATRARRVEFLLEQIHVLSFDHAAARTYAELRAELEQKGRRIDEPDLRIAAICVSGGHLLVSGNRRHFQRVPGLRHEDWLRP
jgi:tRNA(fMet)-specific endonuclease VapC